MHLRLRRRRFGQLAIASATATLLSNLAGKSAAQNSSSSLFGVSLTLASKKITEDLADSTAADNTPEIILQQINLASLTSNVDLPNLTVPAITVDNKNDSTEITNKAITIKKPSERITGFSINANGTFIIATVAATKQGDFSRLVFYGQGKNSSKNKGLKIKKIKKQSTIESLLVSTLQDEKDKQIIGVVSLEGGRPPFILGFIDINSGQINSDASLGLPEIAQNERLNNLTQSPVDRKIYATYIGSENVPILVEIDLEQKSLLTGRSFIVKVAELNINKRPLQNDVASLAFSPSGQLFALADPQYEGTNSIFTVDLKTAQMTFVRKLAVDKIAFTPS